MTVSATERQAIADDPDGCVSESATVQKGIDVELPARLFPGPHDGVDLVAHREPGTSGDGLRHQPAVALPALLGDLVASHGLERPHRPGLEPFGPRLGVEAHP